VVGICGGGGDCCVEGTGPGCNDAECCENVCACDSFCCDVAWDINCAGPNAFVPGCSALELGCCGGGGATGACCQTAGCSIITADECATAGGTYLGDNTSCTGPDIPGNSYNDTVGVAIPDGPDGTVSDTFDVPDSFTIGDVNIDLGISHTWIGDLVITIEHNATSVTIVDRPGYTGTGFGCGEDNLSGVFVDDEGSGGAIEDQCVPGLTSPPNYVPNNPLSAFDGMDAQGTWTITVTDSEGFDTGTLDSWSLHFGTPGPSACIPTGACCTSPTTCFVSDEAGCSGVYLGDGTNCSAAGPVTVYEADANLTIPDAPASPPGAVGEPASHVINVSDSYTIADADIDLVVDHSWVGDLIISVEHGGTTVVIVDRAGFAGTGFGCGSDDYNVIVDDQGTGGAIEDLCGPTSTPTSPPNYTPNNPLSAFNGMNSSGDWTITVNDNANLDTGSLLHWSIHLTQPGEGPCSGVAFCGNGTVESGEECDDGNTSNTDACLNTCENASCGDGFVQAGVEDCDDGNTSNTDSCTNACENATCGDGFVQGSEQCDDGNGIDTDGCTNACNNARCGDGIVRGGFEQCDDGNLVDDDTCTNNCTSPICGDGIVQASNNEECDGLSAEACDGVCLEDCTCEPSAIPTMSEWGLAVMALLLLIGAKLYFGRRELAA
jgi:cysteine-rich repeat protein